MTIDPTSLAASLRRLGTLDGPDIGQALEMTVHACVDLFDVSGSGLMIADEQGALRYVAATDGPGQVLEKVQSETGQGPCVDTYVENTVIATDDLAAEARWPDSREIIAGHGVRAVLGVPVRLGGVTVGSLDVYLDRPHAWDDSEGAALLRYSQVVEATLHTALSAHAAGTLADRLQYALDHRTDVERGIGFVMALQRVDAPTAMGVLRTAAREQGRDIAEVARRVVENRAVPS